MTFIKAGFMTSLPFIGASIGVLLGGVVSDMILKRTGSANLARKLPIVGGLLLASTIVAANYVPNGHNALVILVMSIAFFGQGMTNLGWTVVSDIAPKKLIGLTGGIFNFSANLAGIVTPIVIGVTFQASGSFVGPLIYIAIVALIGAFAYSAILGDIHRLDLREEPVRPRVKPGRTAPYCRRPNWWSNRPKRSSSLSGSNRGSTFSEIRSNERSAHAFGSQRNPRSTSPERELNPGELERRDVPLLRIGLELAQHLQRQLRPARRAQTSGRARHACAASAATGGRRAERRRPTRRSRAAAPG